jgi:hypothetical protein
VFIRKKQNKSGTISVQVITKFEGKSKLVKTIGSSKSQEEVEQLVFQGQGFASAQTYQQS